MNESAEALGRLESLLSTGSVNVKEAQLLMIKYAFMANEMIKVILNVMRRDVKCRRSILQTLISVHEQQPPNAESTDSPSSWKSVIEVNFPLILDACCEKTNCPITDRNTVKGLRSLLRLLPNTSATEYVKRINGILGMTEEEERQRQQQRQVKLEVIEREREGHRGLREQDWMRPVGEEYSTEYILHLKQSIKSLDRSLLYSNLQAFNHPNTKVVVIVQLDEILFPTKENERNHKFKNLMEQVNSCIKDIARSILFYSDLKYFNDQPHVQYYIDEDDHTSLTDYQFNNDKLASFDNRLGSGEKFYRERAYRFREIATVRYPKAAESLNKDLLSDCRRTFNDLDQLMNGTLHRTIELLHSKDTSSFYYISSEPLILALARNVFLGINNIIPANTLFSSIRFGEEWIIKEIQAHYYSKLGHDPIYYYLSVDGAKRIKYNNNSNQSKVHCLEIKNRKDLEDALMIIPNMQRANSTESS